MLRVCCSPGIGTARSQWWVPRSRRQPKSARNQGTREGSTPSSTWAATEIKNVTEDIYLFGESFLTCVYFMKTIDLDILSPYIPRHVIADPNITSDLCYSTKISKGASIHYDQLTCVWEPMKCMDMHVVFTWFIFGKYEFMWSWCLRVKWNGYEIHIYLELWTPLPPHLLHEFSHMGLEVEWSSLPLAPSSYPHNGHSIKYKWEACHG